MNTTVHVILSDEEAAVLTQVAAREGLTVSKWVRRSTREAERGKLG